MLKQLVAAVVVAFVLASVAAAKVEVPQGWQTERSFVDG
jgi:hypothetical protein